MQYYACRASKQGLLLMHLPLLKEYEEDINVTLKRLHHFHLNKVIFLYLNINSIRNNFGDQQKRQQMNFFLMISSYISIISPYTLHLIDNKGGLMVFVKSHIPSIRLNIFKILSNIEIILFETNFSKEKWLVASIYIDPSQKNKYLLCNLKNLLEFYSTWYEDIIILGDFNIEAKNKVMKYFLQEYTFYNNQFHNISRYFDLLPNFPFSTSETMDDYYF